MTLITNDGVSHLIPLSIKVTETDVEEDVDVQDKSPYGATDITSATHPIVNNQDSNEPFPVNILLDTGSIGPDENYNHKDIVNMIHPLNSNSKRPTSSVCSELDNICVANSSYIYITVTQTKFIFVTGKINA